MCAKRHRASVPRSATSIALKQVQLGPCDATPFKIARSRLRARSRRPLLRMLLGDFGADVIKIEPLRGDWSRSMGTTVSASESTTI